MSSKDDNEKEVEGAIGGVSDSTDMNKNSQITNVTDNQCSDEIELVYPSGKLAAMTRKRNQIIKILNETDQSNETNVDTVNLKNLHKEFRQKIENFTTAVKNELSKENVPRDMTEEFNRWTGGHLQTNLDFDRNLAKTINELELIDFSLLMTNSSNIGQLEENALSISRDDVRTSSNQTKIETITEKIKADSEPPTTNAKNDLQLLKEWDNESMASNDDIASINNESKFMDIMEKQNEIALLLAKTQTRSQLPISEPDVFDGSDYLEYRPFIFSFQRTIEERTSDSADRYYCLLKYTKGEARRIVKSCNNQDSSIAYKNAIALLDQNYGNEYNLANKYLEKLEKWPALRGEDSKSLNELALFLVECSSLMSNMNRLNQLDNLKEIRDVVKKLPYGMRKKFREIAGQKVKAGQQIKFQMLVDYVQEQAELLQLPLLGDISDEKLKKKNSSHSKSTKVLSTAVREESTKPKKTNACFCCQKTNHVLDNCFFFAKKPLNEKESFIKLHKICFGCLKSSDHLSKQCKEKLQCKKCKKTHPTSLHRDQQTNRNNESTTTPEVVNNSANENSADMTSAFHVNTGRLENRQVYPAILVKVKFENMNHSILTYIGLDPFSTDCFIDGDLFSNCNVPMQKNRVVSYQYARNKR